MIDVTSRLLSRPSRPARPVKDDGHEYRGHDGIRQWLSVASAQFSYTRTLTGANAVDADTWLVTTRLEGDFPGGVVDLCYRFVLADNLISELEIVPTRRAGGSAPGVAAAPDSLITSTAAGRPCRDTSMASPDQRAVPRPQVRSLRLWLLRRPLGLGRAATARGRRRRAG